MLRTAVKGRLQVLTVALFIVVAGCKEIQTIDVHDYEAWKNLPDGDKAWFPDNVPPTAYDIHATYDLDTSATNIAYSIPFDSLPVVEAALKQTAPADVPRPRMTVNESWWPAVLNNLTRKEASHIEFKFFAYPQKWHSGSIVWGCAIDPNASKVYFWH